MGWLKKDREPINGPDFEGPRQVIFAFLNGRGYSVVECIEAWNMVKSEKAVDLIPWLLDLELRYPRK